MAVLGEELIVKIGADTTELRAGVEQVKQETKRLGDESARTSKQVNSGFKEMRSSVLFLRSNILLLTASIAAISAPVLKADDSLKNLAGTAKLFGADGKSLVNLAKQQGNAFGVSYSTAAKAMQSAIIQQKSLNAAIADMKLAESLSQMGLGGKEEIAGALGGFAKAFGTTEQAAADLGVQAAKLGGDFLATMNAATQMKPQIDAAKMSVTSFMEAMASLQSAGNSPEQALTLISTLMDGVRNKSEGVAELFNSLGIALGPLTLAGGNLNSVLSLLVTNLQNFPQATAAALGGSQAFADMLAGMAASGQSFGQNAGAIQAGMGQIAAATAASASSMKSLEQSAAILANFVTDKLEPALDSVAQLIGYIASKFLEISNFKWPDIPGPGSSNSDKSSFQYQQMLGEMEMKAMGGPIHGIGVGDTVPAMLTPGEFVIKKEIAEKMQPFLSRLNAGGIDPSALWNTSLAGTRVGGDWLLNLLGIDQKIGLRGEIVSALTPGISDRQRELSAIASAMRREVVGFANGGPVGPPTQSHSTTIEGGVNINVTGSQFSQAMLRRQLVPMVEREISKRRSRYRRSAR